MKNLIFFILLFIFITNAFSAKVDTIYIHNVRVMKESGSWNVIVRIPFKSFWWSDEGLHPVRLDVQVQKSDGGISSWCPNNPLTDRLVFGTDNPADLGWLMFRD